MEVAIFVSLLEKFNIGRKTVFVTYLPIFSPTTTYLAITRQSTMYLQISVVIIPLNNIVYPHTLTYTVSPPFFVSY